MSPVFLSVEDVLRIHSDQVGRYGGDSGLRDRGLLESAVEMPRAGFGGQLMHDDLFSMAAAYMLHIARNHPFVDGNKRAATASALMFLELNGYPLRTETEAMVSLALRVATGDAGKPEIAAFFRDYAEA